MNRRCCLLVFIIPIFTVLAVSAVLAQNAQAANNAALIRDIENNLIAPCCWNQPISEHPSEVSDRMRAEVQAMVTQGKGRDEILDYYVAQYGERILATPRAKGINVLAYIAPWALLVLGGGGLFALLKNRRAPAPAQASAAPENLAAGKQSGDLSANRPASHYADIVEKELGEMDD